MESIPEISDHVRQNIHSHEVFLTGVEKVFRVEPSLKAQPSPIHSIKARLKDLTHLEQKIERKLAGGVEITKANVFDKITDLAGIRVIHLHQTQFTPIHACIQKQIDNHDWVLFEPPKAYTWDPESRVFFEGHGLTVHVKDSFYTSIHYVVKPRADSMAACEIQVRTLFEEIWGEIDHTINYPTPTENESCREQIRVLARLVGAGSRLADSIFKTHQQGAHIPPKT